ncbi:MAG: hypothetical protein HQ510_01860 [Candidatus Marinimicrobia bacterium]|nr:hypothetical protein [Candidatus Neomarinimicrobiota bacterium]
MKTRTIVVSLIFGLVAFWGCDDNSTEPNSDSIICSWEKEIEEGSLVTLSFLENDTFTAIVEGGIGDVVSGTYIISVNEITFVDDGCSEEEGGIYTYSISGDQLIFILISDDCDRNEIIPGTWTKK